MTDVYVNTELAIIIGKMKENKCYHHPRCPECLDQYGVYIRRVRAVDRNTAKRAGHRICMPGSCCRGFWQLSVEELREEDDHSRQRGFSPYLNPARPRTADRR